MADHLTNPYPACMAPTDELKAHLLYWARHASTVPEVALRLREAAEMIEHLEREAKSWEQTALGAEARIDELMLEYCPDEMTEEQRERWAAAQRPVSAEETARIDKAVKS